MKIGIDVRSLLEREAGGISVYTEKIIKHLLAIDAQNEYLLFSNSYKNSRSLIENKFTEDNAELKFFSYPNKVLNASFRFLNQPKIDKMLGGVDLFFEPNIIFMALSQIPKKVITLHDLSFLLYPNLYSAKGRFWHQVINVRRMVSQFDKIIAVSDHTRNDIIELLKVPSDKVQRIYPGIDHEFYKNVGTEDKNNIIKKYDLPEKFILSLAALEPRKNIEMVVEAFAEFSKESDCRLVLAGASQGSELLIDQLISKNGISDKVRTLGYIPNEDKPALYQLAECFVYPSFYEGFGFPPLEAMSSGTPVIASYSSSLSEICGNSALLIDPHNIEELTEAFKQILNDSHFSDKLAQRGRIQAEKFTWEQSARETLNLFQNLVK
ncbi:MAG: glycosyltransferase family 1 protein [Patescibacteria group bacterium]|jgi:glycosyltransferase involved in cell wall biosynthesis